MNVAAVGALEEYFFLNIKLNLNALE